MRDTIPRPDIPAAPDELSAIDRSSLADRVTVQIRQAIVGGVLPPGEQIGVREIARRLGVSATPVREALFQLRSIGLVEFLPGQVRIVAPTPEALQQAFELREALEGMAAHLAAKRHTPTEGDRIARLAEESRLAAESGNAAVFRAADVAFHETIGVAARSEQLRRYLKNALDLALTLRNLRNLQAAHRVNQPFAFMHELIAEAIRAGDADKAEALSRAHVRKVCELIGGQPPDRIQSDRGNDDGTGLRR